MLKATLPWQSQAIFPLCALLCAFQLVFHLSCPVTCAQVFAHLRNPFVRVCGFWYFLTSQVFGKSNTNTNTHTRTRERKVRARFTFHGINHFDLLRSNMELLGMATWSAKPMIRYPATQAQTNTHIKHPLYMMHLVTPWWVCRHARKKDQNLVWTLQ